MKVLHTAHGIPREPGRLSDDAFRVLERDGRLVAALADGLGSARDGRAAAQRAVTMITDNFLGRPQAWSPRRALMEFAAQINRTLFEESKLRHDGPEMLCTLCVAALEGGTLFGANIGDSPVYLFRGDSVRRLSENHALTEHDLEHVLTQALGATETVTPHFFQEALEDGDIVVLCSDGVSHAVSPEALVRLLQRRASARSLVAAAGEAAQAQPELCDDASAIVIEVVRRGLEGAMPGRTIEVAGRLAAGDVFDGFELVRSLQEGGRVWLAQQRDARPVVLKFPPAEAAEDEARRDAFAHEAWQATRIQSPDFVPAHIPEQGPLRYYVMEYIDAPTVHQALARGPLSVDDAIHLGRFLLRAGQTLLRHDVAHGDIKPENILAQPGPDGIRFRLLDLGSAAPVFSVTSRAGTASFLAPERFHGAALSERTEVYAIGVTLFQALTRSFPFGEIERFQTPRFENQPKRPTRINPAIPGWLEAALLRATSADPDRRYQAFSEMAYDLDHPEQVVPFYRKDAPLLERNPLLFYKLLCVVLLLTNVALLFWLTRT